MYYLKKKNVKPAPPLTTNDALVLGGKLGFKTSDTSKMLQDLFSAGLITYIRTDSSTLSKEFKSLAKEYIKNTKQIKCGEGLSGRKTKNAQEAHEAIRPVYIEKETIEGMNSNVTKLYEAIWLTTVISLLENGIDIKNKYQIKIDKYLFEATHTATKYRGWREFAGKESIEPRNIAEGDKIKDIEIIVEERKTKPPKHYTQISFLKDLERKGIGRPSTFASILTILFNRKYIQEFKVAKKEYIKSSEAGVKSIEFLSEYFKEFVNLTYTSEMETKLDEIALANKTKNETLKPFNELLETNINNFYNELKKLMENVQSVIQYFPKNQEFLKKVMTIVSWDALHFQSVNI